MIRWFIRKVLLYSHDRRVRSIELFPNEVNIISGRSSTGKSAIVEIIDYSMGSSECFLPEIVRARCSWVGLLWERADSQFLVCRQVPTAQKQSTGACYFNPGPKVVLPKTGQDIVSNVNRKALVRKVDEIFGIGDISIQEARGRQDAPPSPVSMRNTMPFILVDDTVIIDKKTLFRGQDDQHRQGIVDTFPYFLGVVDEEFVEAEARLRGLQRKLDKLRREYQRLDEADRDVLDDALALLREAASLGMTSYSENDLTLREAAELLGPVARWSGQGAESDWDDHLAPLYERERDLSRRAASLRSDVATIKQHLRVAEDFASGVTAAQQRLEVVNLFRGKNIKERCPVCDQPLAEVSDSVEHMRGVLDRVQSELGRIQVGRPKLDRALRDTQAAVEHTSRELETVRRQISALVEESNRAQEYLRLDQRRQYVAGGANWFLKKFAGAAGEEKLTEIQEVEHAIEELEEGAGLSTVKDREYGARVLLSSIATEILDRLPFEKDYRGHRVDFNFSELKIGVLKHNRFVPLRAISGDKNFLSMHIALFLALHRYFYGNSGKVPGVIVFDQISRPFFPEKMAMDDDDWASVARYFDVLFTEVERGESLQIIVLEHAYLRNEKFHAATKQRWRGEEDGLVPNDWPATED